MKHQTNIAGEWSVGDKIIDHEIDDNLVFTLNRIENCFYYLYDKNQQLVGKWDEDDIKSGFTNITEMQRALGRV
tara:strand:+ start:564 stop:785 length:222 start_codon:yes stop_codon:yes gene_type:complete